MFENLSPLSLSLVDTCLIIPCVWKHITISLPLLIVDTCIIFSCVWKHTTISHPLPYYRQISNISLRLKTDHSLSLVGACLKHVAELQLISLHDFKFNKEFVDACNSDVQTHCKLDTLGVPIKRKWAHFSFMFDNCIVYFVRQFKSIQRSKIR